MAGTSTTIENHIHKQPDPEQQPVGHTNIFFREGIEPATPCAVVDRSATAPTVSLK